MNRTDAPQNQRGWTLLELAVVLVIAALLAVVALPLLPLGTRLSEEQLAEQRLLEAQDALLGFARAQLRLPSADADGDGKEDAGAASGRLPYKTLGIFSSSPMGYMVNSTLSQNADAALYNPTLPPGTGVPNTPLRNGLDLCVRLDALQRGNTDLAGTSVAAAYLLSHRLPDQGGATADLLVGALPGDPSTLNPSLSYVGQGVGELSTRLACPDRLRRAFSAAQAADAAHSGLMLSEQNARIRSFYVDVTKLEQTMAEVGVRFAQAAIAMAAMDAAVAAGQAIPDLLPPEDAFQVILAVASLADASTALGLAKIDLDSANSDLEGAKENYILAKKLDIKAKNDLARTQKLFAAAAQQARRMDEAGLDP